MQQAIQKSLLWRYATKQFDPHKTIPESDFQQIKDAMRLAPSSFGLQPWKFVQVKDRQIRQELRKAAWDQPQITDASHLVVFTRIKVINEAVVDRFIEQVATDRGMSPEDLAPLKKMIMGSLASKSTASVASWAEKQTYIALGFALESAALLKIDACPMEGFDNQAFDRILDLSNIGLASTAVAAFGYRSADDKYATATKSRFPESEVFVTV